MNRMSTVKDSDVGFSDYKCLVRKWIVCVWKYSWNFNTTHDSSLQFINTFKYSREDHILILLFLIAHYIYGVLKSMTRLQFLANVWIKNRQCKEVWEVWCQGGENMWYPSSTKQKMQRILLTLCTAFVHIISSNCCIPTVRTFWVLKWLDEVTELYYSPLLMQWNAPTQLCLLVQWSALTSLCRNRRENMSNVVRWIFNFSTKMTT